MRCICECVNVAAVFNHQVKVAVKDMAKVTLKVIVKVTVRL